MKHITEEMIEAWIGSDNMSVNDFIELLTEIINGEYTLDNFRADVLEFHKNLEDEADAQAIDDASWRP
jgi:hypothetical protein